MSGDSYFSQFNSIQLTRQQKEAITCALGPSIIVAGAGSGKTSVIAHRFLYMVQHMGIDPRRILLVTFTRQAVKNMEKRIKGYVTQCTSMRSDIFEAINKNIHVMTFHGLCKQILTWVYEKKDKGAATKYVHDAHFIDVLKEVMKQFPNIKALGKTKEILIHLRKICKSQHRKFTEEDLVDIALQVDTIHDRAKLLQKYPFHDMSKIYEKFDQGMKKKKLGTLDDLLLNASNYLLSSKDIVKEWSGRYDAILCDEFQDVDDIQFNILTKLSSDDHNLFCVGDPDQAIYGFRGSLPQVFLKLKKHFDTHGVYTKIKKLEQNFRSTPQILNVANALINSAPVIDELRKNLRTDKKDGEMPTMKTCKSSSEQADAVANQIFELHKQGVKLSDIAVLARKKSNYTKVKNRLMYQSIHYEDYKEVFPLLKNKVIKDLVGWISIAFVRNDAKQWFSHLKRVYNTPSIGVGPTTFQKLMDSMKNNYEDVMNIMQEMGTDKSALQKLIWKINRLKTIADDPTLALKDKYWEIGKESGILEYYEKKFGKDSSKFDTIQKFLDSPLVAKAKTWHDALVHVEQYLNVDNKDRVVCSTIHGVKGLEFKYVFLISLSEGHIPTARGLKLCKDEEKKAAYIDDERRVFYVAITRAKDHLYMFTDKETPSIFLEDIKSCFTGDMPQFRLPDSEVIEEVEAEVYEDGDDDFGATADVL